MARWTRAQVEGLAPDDRSITAARKLAKPGPWSETGSTDTLLWGKCQGSGKNPYQVSVDLTGPAVKCSCPSRKFPCKHGLALLMLWVDGAGSVPDAAEAADFASDWATGRADRAAATAERRQKKASEPVDPEAQARRLEKRLRLMTDGVVDFELWLADLYRQGLAAARLRPYHFWDDAASRLTDAQLPGLAARVRSLPESLFGREDWADTVLVETGRWFTAVRAWQQRELLSEDDQANLRTFMGWPVPTEEVLAGARLTDQWVIEGVHRSDDGRLQSQRTWVRGTESGETMVVLDFAAGGAVLNTPQVVGSVVSTALVRYPGSGVRRAMFVEEPVTSATSGPPGEPLTISGALAHVAEQYALNPFVDRVPALVAAAVVVEAEDHPVIADAEASLPLVPDADVWEMLARTGGAIAPIFVEIDAGEVRPLAVEVDGERVGL